MIEIVDLDIMVWWTIVLSNALIRSVIPDAYFESTFETGSFELTFDIIRDKGQLNWLLVQKRHIT